MFKLRIYAAHLACSCRHADAPKLEATLEGERKVHAIGVEGLHAQLRQALVENSHLEQKLKDEQHVAMQKQKELDDTRREAADTEKQPAEVIGYLHKMLICALLCHTFIVTCLD
jgi:hypothetical protein